jgi:hypothetical protein
VKEWSEFFKDNVCEGENLERLKEELKKDKKHVHGLDDALVVYRLIRTKK